MLATIRFHDLLRGRLLGEYFGPIFDVWIHWEIVTQKSVFYDRKLSHSVSGLLIFSLFFARPILSRCLTTYSAAPRSHTQRSSGQVIIPSSAK